MKYSMLCSLDQIVRLVDGARESEGRVEVFRDGQWGTICDDNWDIKDANVVCRMLNYSRALRSPHHAFFGTGNGKIWLSNLDCVGSETSILQCEHEGGQVDTCDHHEDASVICERDAANLGEIPVSPNLREHSGANVIEICKMGSKTKNGSHFWRSKPVFWELNSIFVTNLSFVSIIKNQYGRWSLERTPSTGPCYILNEF